jgi:hypothetical protein
LRPTSDRHALSIVRSILLGEDIFENGKLVIINIEQVVLLIVIVVKVDDAEVVCGTLIVSLLSRVVMIGVGW